VLASPSAHLIGEPPVEVHLLGLRDGKAGALLVPVLDTGQKEEERMKNKGRRAASRQLWQRGRRQAGYAHGGEGGWGGGSTTEHANFKKEKRQ